MASSASMLQCSFTGGRLRCLAISLFLIVRTSSIDLPLTLQRHLTASADIQPSEEAHLLLLRMMDCKYEQACCSRCHIGIWALGRCQYEAGEKGLLVAAPLCGDAA